MKNLKTLFRLLPFCLLLLNLYCKVSVNNQPQISPPSWIRGSWKTLFEDEVFIFDTNKLEFSFLDTGASIKISSSKSTDILAAESDSDTYTVSATAAGNKYVFTFSKIPFNQASIKCKITRNSDALSNLTLFYSGQ